MLLTMKSLLFVLVFCVSLFSDINGQDDTISVDDNYYDSGQSFRMPFLLESSESNLFIETFFKLKGIQLDSIVSLHENGTIDIALSNGVANGFYWKVDSLLTLQNEKDTVFILYGKSLFKDFNSNLIQLQSYKASTSTYGEALNLDVLFEFSEIEDPNDQIILYQNSPNPFKYHTIIPMYLPRGGEVNLAFYDMLGRPIGRSIFQGKKGLNFLTFHYRILLILERNGKDIWIS